MIWKLSYMNITKEDFWDSLKFTLQTWVNTELFVFPRSSNLPLELKNKFWVYILFSNINQEGKIQTYIGESNNLYERIIQHLEKKEFWNIAYIFTDKDLNKTLNLSLEKAMIKLVRETKHPYYPFVCDNVSQWSYQPLKEEEKKYLVSVLENIQLLLDINQIPLFLKPNWVLFSSLNIQEKKTRTKTKSSSIHKELPLFSLWWATLKVEDNRYILLQGSTLSPLKEWFYNDWTKRIDTNNWLIKDNVLLLDISFSSPTKAAQYVLSETCKWEDMWLDENWYTLAYYIKG